MTTKVRRENLMIYLAEATDKKVNALYTLLEEEIKDTSFTLTDEHLNILEQRRADYLGGKSTVVPWEEVHEKIRNKRKNA
jgi:putative addiction module component (TIGR02574 family)